ncbi:MAG: hypothetical protein ACYTGL_24510 [Planctomycetota bacterium]|jgi:polyhydroxyalkanoate synthesis regulator phasin
MSRKIPKALLKALIAVLEDNPILKGGGTFISELAAEDDTEVSDDEWAELADATPDELQSQLSELFSQVRVGTVHSAEAAANTDAIKGVTGEILGKLDEIARTIHEHALQTRVSILEHRVQSLEEENERLRKEQDSGHSDESLRRELVRLMEEGKEVLERAKDAFSSEVMTRDRVQLKAENEVRQWIETTTEELNQLRIGWGMEFATIEEPSRTDMLCRGRHKSKTVGELNLHIRKLAELLSRLD